MRVWILKKHPDHVNWSDEDNPWMPWYDKCTLQVVVATSFHKARQLAASHAGDEGPEVWLDAKRTTCSRLRTDTECVAAREVSWA